jgi:hypothetical protein
MAYLCCCCKSAENDALLPDQKRNDRKIIASRHSKSVDGSYEPPKLSFQDVDTTNRLSLPHAPAQRTCSLTSSSLRHRAKSGYVKKKGHLLKNWKRRFLVLKGFSS